MRETRREEAVPARTSDERILAGEDYGAVTKLS